MSEEDKMASIRAAKRELRSILNEQLSHLEKNSITAQSSAIASTLFAQKEFQAANSISVYLSMPSGEVHTPEIVRHALSAGKKVFVPYFYSHQVMGREKKSMIMDMVQLLSLQDYENLEPDSWGIPTPSADSIQHRANCFGGVGRSVDMRAEDGKAEGSVDVVITPGLGFDEACGRLGRGKGFYDRFFERCQTVTASRGSDPWRVGLGLTEQILPRDQKLPMDATDVRLDALIVGDGRIIRRPSETD